MKAHTRETVFIKLQEEHTPSGNTQTYAKTVEDYLAKMPTTCIYRRKANEAELTTLAPVRGKIVLFRDYPGGDPNLGIPYESGYTSIADDY